MANELIFQAAELTQRKLGFGSEKGAFFENVAVSKEEIQTLLSLATIDAVGMPNWKGGKVTIAFWTEEPIGDFASVNARLTEAKLKTLPFWTAAYC